MDSRQQQQDVERFNKAIRVAKANEAMRQGRATEEDLEIIWAYEIEQDTMIANSNAALEAWGFEAQSEPARSEQFDNVLPFRKKPEHSSGPEGSLI